MRSRSDESRLHKLDHRGVIHGRVGYVVLTHKWRNNEVRHPETQLRSEPLFCRRVGRICARIGAGQVAVHAAVGHAGIETVRILRNGPDIRRHAQARIRVVVRMTRNRWHVVERPAAFVIAQEEHGIVPR